MLTLDRPDRLNAYTPAMGARLAAELARCDDDHEVRAVVVTGAGRAFCAGQDMSGAGGFAGAVGATSRNLAEHRPLRPWQMRTPVIAAINGHAVGIGLTMTLQWDVRFVAADATLALPFVRRGILPDALSGWTLPRLIGVAAATELILTGRSFTGAEAHRLGIATAALPAGDVLGAAMQCAQDIAASTSPSAVAMAKALLWASTEHGRREAFEAVERRGQTWMTAQPDAAEGPRAFLEKRAPRWEEPSGLAGALAAIRGEAADVSRVPTDERSE